MFLKYKLGDPSLQPEHAGVYWPEVRTYFRKISKVCMLFVIIFTIAAIYLLSLKVPAMIIFFLWLPSFGICLYMSNEYAVAGEEPE